MLIKSIVKYIPATDTHIYDKKNFIYSEIIFEVFASITVNPKLAFLKSASNFHFSVKVLN
jgi:hypothetical protein